MHLLKVNLDLDIFNKIFNIIIAINIVKLLIQIYLIPLGK